MKRIITSCACALILCVISNAQTTQWKNYCTRSSITCIVPEGKTMWIGTWNDGIFQVDLNGNIIRSFTKNAGLAENQVNCIVIDKKGRKWVGSNLGVSCFDEQKWQVYNTLNGLADNKVQTIAIDNNDRKWFGTAMGISIYNDTLWKTITETDGLASNYICSIVIKADGNAWVADGASVSLIPNTLSGIVNYGYSDGLPGAGVKKLAIDGKGVLWAIGNMCYVSKFENNSWTILVGGIADFGRDNSDCVVDADGKLWIALSGTDGGLIRVDSLTQNLLKTNYSSTNGLSSNRVTSCAVDAEGHVWYGTSDQGAGKFDGVNWVNFPYVTGVAGNFVFVNSIAVDKQNGKWFGTDNGLFRFDGNSWKSYSTTNGLVSNSIQSVAVDEQNNLWIGSNKGVTMFDGKSWTTYTTTDGLINNNVFTIFIDNKGVKWIGTGANVGQTKTGISKFDGKTWETITFSNDIPQNTIQAITCDKQGTMWFATAEGVVNYKNGSSTRYTKTDGLVNNFTESVLNDARGNMWIGTSGGASKFDGTSWTSFPSVGGVNGNAVKSIFCDKNNNVWLSTYNGGVSVYNGTSWETFNFYNGLESNQQICSAIDQLGNMWFGSNIGVSVYNENGVDIPVVDSFTRVSGRVYIDNDTDNVFSPGDFYLNNQKVLLLPDSMYTFTNQMGEYSFQVDSGKRYTVRVIPQEFYHNTNDHLSDTITANHKNNWLRNIAVTGSDQISVTSTLTAGINRCGFGMPLSYTFTNSSNHVVDALVSIEIDGRVKVAQSIPVADSVGGNRLFWKYNNLPISLSKTINIYTDSMDNSFDTLVFRANVACDGLVVSADSLLLPGKCSFDPNDKQVLPAGVTSKKLTRKDETLTYTIRFQNTGNDYAYDIKIIDTLDTQLDLSTFAIITSSHTVKTNLASNGVVTFTFQGIMLPDSAADQAASNGFVTYTSKAKSTVEDSSVINNAAYIYFDQNDAVKTNTTTNMLVTGIIAGDANGNGVIDGTEIAGDKNNNSVIDNGEISGDTNGNGQIDSEELNSTTTTLVDICDLGIGPVPVKEKVEIISSKACHVSSVTITNIAGETVLTGGENTRSIDVSRLSHGTYVVTVLSNGTRVSRMIVK